MSMMATRGMASPASCRSARKQLMPTIRVLYVETTASMRCCSKLFSVRPDIDCASPRPVEALDVFESWVPYVLVLDANLPVSSVRLLRQMRELDELETTPFMCSAVRSKGCKVARAADSPTTGQASRLHQGFRDLRGLASAR